jgi:glycosyltransferase involved in cell wall biosynthesis
MRILVHSNAPWVPTGYGQQTAQLVQRLAADGHEVAISAFYGLQGAKLEWNGITVYPQYMEPYGADVLIAHAEDWFGGDLSDGLIITLVDAWVLPAAQLREANVLMWVPIDHEPAPPKVIDAVKASEATAVAMSRHGERMMKAEGIDCEYAPHGIDTSSLSPKGRGEWRKMIQPEIPEDWFVAGIVAANKGNPSRKSFEVSFQAFARHLQKYPESLLYVHSEATGAVNGVGLIDLAQACGITPENIRFSPQYNQAILGFQSDFMASVFSSFDVLLNPAQGEGFGIPVVEAQACGVPVIVTDWTAMSELCGAGWKVDGQKVFSVQRSWVKSANVHEVALALEKAYHGRGKHKNRARSFAEKYDADKVYDEHWRPILDKWEDHFEGRVVVDEPKVEVVA